MKFTLSTYCMQIYYIGLGIAMKLIKVRIACDRSIAPESNTVRLYMAVVTSPS